MLVQETPASEARVPVPPAGTALRVTRYGKVQAVVINPEDFAMVETLLDAYRAHPPVELELTDAELRVHEATDARETEDEYDYEGLARAIDG
jgi:PHD/YefM family antitoxin component YafN of YafNO toxin-antitoxin module